jgi:hypothetical protein
MLTCRKISGVIIPLICIRTGSAFLPETNKKALQFSTYSVYEKTNTQLFTVINMNVEPTLVYVRHSVPAFRICHISKYLTLPNLVGAGITQSVYRCAMGRTAGGRFFSSQRPDRLWEPSQPSIQCVKLPEHEADHSV